MELRYFTPREFKMDGVVVFDKMSPVFLMKLDEVRHLAGIPIRPPTSCYRTPAKNKAVGGAHDSYHLLGRAVDVPVITGRERALIVNAALGLGLSVGIMENAIHIDDREHQVLFHYYAKYQRKP